VKNPCAVITKKPSPTIPKGSNTPANPPQIHPNSPDNSPQFFDELELELEANDFDDERTPFGLLLDRSRWEEWMFSRADRRRQAGRTARALHEQVRSVRVQDLLSYVGRRCAFWDIADLRTDRNFEVERVVAVCTVAGVNGDMPFVTLEWVSPFNGEAMMMYTVEPLVTGGLITWF
jgi:hypothetical protein